MVLAAGSKPAARQNLETSEEVKSYNSLNKEVFYVRVNYNGDKKDFYLRNRRSKDILYTLTTNWSFYTSLFVVEPGINESNSHVKKELHDFQPKNIESGFIICGRRHHNCFATMKNR